MSQRLRREKATSSKSKKWRLAGIVAGTVLGVFFLVGLVGAILALRTIPPPAVHTDPAAARRLEQELKEAQSASNDNPRTVRADETEVNSMFKQQFDSATSGTTDDSAAVVRDMKMTLSDDRVRLYVLANLRGKDITFQIEGRLRSLDGYMDFDPISGRIGSLPLPKASLKSAVAKMLTTPEGLETMHLPKNVRDLRVEGGRLVLTFR